ncbi:MAG: DUF4835 family protein [Prevotellaceae bacterium]|jgi:hypothetical protein|nr:DUF4835 family protein [Prevotellaceae bacterium]
MVTSITSLLLRSSRKHLLLAVTLCACAALQAQTVRCNVTLNTQKVQNTNRTLFETLKTEITNFVNNRAWTNHTYQQFERIECNFIITLNEQAGEDEFKGTLQIQAQRPVYGSIYSSPTINTIDNNFEFSYKENEVLDFSENTHSSNLTSMLAYWVYVVVGLDYDTFSANGGTEWFRKAERIAQNAQSETRSGWSSSSGLNHRNRYWLTENILGSKYTRERQAYYTYHRLGLDMMSDKPEEGRRQVMLALQEMQKLYKEKPDNTLYFYTIFFDTKADEIANIFSEATPAEKQAAYQLLSAINNTNDPKYKKLK